MKINEKLVGEKIYLRNLTESNASSEYCSWLSDPEVNKNIVTKKTTIEELKKYIKEKNQDPKCLFLGIFYKENNKHIGNIKIEKINFKNKNCDLGIIIGDKNYWGKGIATEATELIVNYGFYILNLNEIELGVTSDNIAAIRAYKKTGFIKVKEEKIKINEIEYDRYIMVNKKKRLCLGTVQLGLNYGINNPHGKPPLEESLKILKYAFENGIKIFDTATAYGNAEEILGEFIKKNKLQNRIFVISKLMPNLFSGNEDQNEVNKIIENEINKSLNRLNLKCLYGYLLHTPGDIYNEKIVLALKNCKLNGLIDNLGVSIYEEKDALYAANLPVDFIQIPYSIFDQRMDKTDFFKICKKNKVTVFARSAFLQGLTVMDKEKVPKHLEESKKYLDEFDEIIKKNNFSRVEASLLFSYNNLDIDYVVFGVDNLEQLEQDIKIVEKETNTSKIIKNLKDKFMGINKSIIFPSLWKKP
jgi:aryl-alcohol dehydrogenase-like predicted oxidoreductase